METIVDRLDPATREIDFEKEKISKGKDTSHAENHELTNAII